MILNYIVIVISDGLTEASPHCSWNDDCSYTEATKSQCANALCKAQGFAGGKFLYDSNNFCTESFTDDYCYVYLLNSDEIVYEKLENEAQITAECKSGNRRICLYINIHYLYIMYEK